MNPARNGRYARGLRIGPWRFRASVVPTVATIAVLALLISLGRWQWGRAEGKEALQREFTQRAADQAMRIAASPATASWASDETVEAMRYVRAQVGGTYDARYQYLLDNRVYEGVAGYHVLTPLLVEDGSFAVLVNRGWVPVGSSRATLPEIPAPGSRVTVEGLLSPPGQGGLLLGASGYESGQWPRVVQRIELDRMQSQLETSLYPLILLLDPGEADGFVREWRPYYGISPNRHRAYAFQWWSLAVALVVIYLVVNLSRSGND